MQVSLNGTSLGDGLQSDQLDGWSSLQSRLRKLRESSGLRATTRPSVATPGINPANAQAPANLIENIPMKPARVAMVAGGVAVGAILLAKAMKKRKR